MRTRTERRVAARYRWDRLKVSFWFTSVVMALAAMLLAWIMFAIDGLIPNELLENSRFILAGTTNELRSSLLSIAGTVLATAGVVFTLLTLPLSTVAAQYGSRLLRLFLGDRTAQFVLGMFVATFVYCIFAALAIPPADVDLQSPQLTATVGVYMMLVTFATLILLIQHISTMLQAPNIAAAAGAELLDVVRAEVTEAPVHGVDGDDRLATMSAAVDDPAALVEAEGYPVRAAATGYTQFVDPDVMLALAQEKNLVIRLLRQPGRFVRLGAVVALVWPADRVDQEVAKLIHRAYQLGNVRTPTQDIEYAVNQLTEMAVRAMSPAINDPFTAMTCLDHVRVGLAEFIRRGEQSPYCYDKDGRLRLLLQPVTFATLLSAAFDMLRHASCDNANVLLHMLEVIDAIGQETTAPAARQELLRHVNLIQAESEAGDLIEQDRQAIKLRGQALRVKLADTT
jgi:uncharacterized membrane protein